MLPASSSPFPFTSMLWRRVLFSPVLSPIYSLAKRATAAALNCLASIRASLFAASSIVQRFSIYLFPPVINQEVVQFALSKLESCPPSVSSAQLLYTKRQPIDKRIIPLMNLYRFCEEKLEKALNAYKDDPNPWEQREVIDAADTYMKVGYAIGCLTLQDLQPFIENLKETKQQGITPVGALIFQNFYQHRAFYYCTNAYHMIRGGAIWDDEDGEMMLSSNSIDIPETHSKPFYTQGTIQNSWNQLYNNYCRLIRSYVTEKDLEAHDTRHVKWTQTDTKDKNFIKNPGPQPM